MPQWIEGEGFLLRQWQVEDAAWYVAARDAEIYHWTSEKRDLSIAEAQASIRQVNAGRDALCFAIVDAGTGELLGNIALELDSQDAQSAEIMYWLAPWARGRGIATRAVTRLCAWAFSAGYQRITLKTMRGNLRSQRVAERAGFHLLTERQEGDANNAFDQWYELRAGEQAEG